MSVKISPETRRVLQGYIDGRVSNAELDDWLTQAEYDDELARAERDALAGIRLTLIEVSEGSSKPISVSQSVAALLAAAERSRSGRRARRVSHR